MTETSGASHGAATPSQATELNDGAALRAVVGPNAHIFMGRWVGMLERAGRKSWRTVWRPSLNWPALLLGSPWFFYRKMYLAGGASALTMIGIGMARPLLALPTGVELLAQLGFGLFANSFYLRHVLRLARRRDNDADRASAGGVSWPSAIFLTLAAGALAAITSVLMAGYYKGHFSSLSGQLQRCADARVIAAVRAAHLQQGDAAAPQPGLAATNVGVRIHPDGKATCFATFAPNPAASGNGAGVYKVTVHYAMPQPGQEAVVKLLH